jgi:hypothetical protein
VTLGDVNGDGKLDIITANLVSNNSSVLLGNGNGTFQTHATFATGNQPYTVTLGDVNGDGRLDLVTANFASSTNTVSVLLGNGNGTFQTNIDFATGTRPNFVTLGDLNSDGKLDIITAHITNNNASVLLNTATSFSAVNFTPQANFTTGLRPSSVTVGDVNGDGILDFVTANSGSNNASVLLGNGDGTFQNQATFATGTKPYSVTLGDVNGDGKLDIITANFHSSNAVSVLLGNGNGTFKNQNTFAPGNSSDSVTLGDVNGDGKLDIVTANTTGTATDNAGVLLGNGNGTFKNQATFTTGNRPLSIKLGDVNGDGKLDIVTANYVGGNVSVLLGNGNGTFKTQATFATGFAPKSVTLGDVNGDGKLDIVTANYGNDNASVLLGNGNGTFQNQNTFATGTDRPRSLTIGDVNGDGKLDILKANYSSDTASVLLNSIAFNGQTFNIKNATPTSTSLAASSNPSVFGQSVTFTATVTGSSGTPTGTITFKNGSTTLGTGTLNGSGVAIFSTSSLAVGNTYSITAIYSGDSSFVTSTSSAVSQVVNQANTTTTLASTNPSVFGQSVTFTATVAATAPGAGNATGTVQFYDNGSAIGSAVTLTSGSATSAAITNFGVGSHSITAIYSGDSSFVTSTSSAVSQVVNQASTTTTLATTSASVFGQSVTFTATVAANSPGAGTANGTITFKNGSTIIGTGTLISGTATLSIASLAVGSNSITAVYGGDSSFVTSTSSAVSQIVNQASTTTTLATTSASVFGQSVTFTATVAATAPGAGNATGSVSFFDGTTQIGTGNLSAGVATLTTSTLSAGSHSITAVYSGDSSFVTSTSSAVSQVVNPGAANTPTFGTPTSTADGFTVQIINYNGSFTYAETATVGSVSINGTGFLTVAGVLPNTSSTVTINTIQTNYANGSALISGTSLASKPLVTGTSPPLSSGGSSTVTLYDPATGKPVGIAVPFPGFNGPVKVVSGDFNNDGVADIIAGAGLGGGPAIAIIDSKTGQVIKAFFAFDPAFTGGVFIAVQDVNGDGILDIIVAAGPGGGPEVRIFDGRDLNVLRAFYAYAEDFSGGVSVASIDLNNDGILDLVTGAGPGGAAHVKVFDGLTNVIISQWYSYPVTFTGGVFVAVGDIGNDGTFEVLTGAGPGGAPVVGVWDPFTGALLSQFMAYAQDFTGGARVGINDGNGDGVADILTGAGPGGGPQVNVFSFPALDLLFSFYSGDPANTGGVFVG